MGKQISVLFIIAIFTLMTFGCNKTVVKTDVPIVEVEKEVQKVDCPKDTVYLVDNTSLENTIIYVCVNELGRAEGKVLAFYADTKKIKAVAEFRREYKVGKWARWDKSGELISIENYNDSGQPHGYIISWFYIGVERHSIIFELSKGVLVNLAYEYKNEEILKILKVKSPERGAVEIVRSKMTKSEIEYFNKLYVEIMSEETKNLPTP